LAVMLHVFDIAIDHGLANFLLSASDELKK